MGDRFMQKILKISAFSDTIFFRKFMTISDFRTRLEQSVKLFLQTPSEFTTPAKLLQLPSLHLMYPQPHFVTLAAKKRSSRIVDHLGCSYHSLAEVLLYQRSHAERAQRPRQSGDV